MSDFFLSFKKSLLKKGWDELHNKCSKIVQNHLIPPSFPSQLFPPGRDAEAESVLPAQLCGPGAGPKGFPWSSWALKGKGGDSLETPLPCHPLQVWSSGNMREDLQLSEAQHTHFSAPKIPSVLSPQQWSVIFTHFWCSYTGTKKPQQKMLRSSTAQNIYLSSYIADDATDEVLPAL